MFDEHAWMQAPFWHAEAAWALAIRDCKDLTWVLTREWALARDTTVIKV